MTSSSSSSSPSSTLWEVLNSGSFASVKVTLPPHGSSIHCESDAVVTLSQELDVRGSLSGGLWAGLSRIFLTNETFFTTIVQNTSHTASRDALLAPPDPGSLTLHCLSGARNDALLLTSGAYLASDPTIEVKSEMRNTARGSLLSGTGFFVLKATGSGTIALSSYGSIHKYTLLQGETRRVDNGHLVAWTTSTRQRMVLASLRSGMMGSLTSGEGLMVEFEGPGIVYVQSHKPPPKVGGGDGGGGNAFAGRNGFRSPVERCLQLVVVLVVLSVVVGLLIVAYLDNQAHESVFKDGTDRSWQYQNYQQHHQQHQRDAFGRREF